MNFFVKLIFYFKKPKIIIVTGKDRDRSAEAIFQFLNRQFKIKKVKNNKLNVLTVLKKEILIFEIEEKDPKSRKNVDFLAKNSKLPVLVITNIGEIPSDRKGFNVEKKEVFHIRQIVKFLPPKGYLVLNFDDAAVKEIGDLSPVRSLSFGLQEKADFQASDIHLNEEINFKINYKGNSVPFWLEKPFLKEKVYSVLGAACVAEILGLNLVEVSQSLKI